MLYDLLFAVVFRVFEKVSSVTQVTPSLETSSVILVVDALLSRVLS